MTVKMGILFLFPLLVASSIAFAAEVPAWTGSYVNDYAGILNNSAELESILEGLKANTTVEFAVVTLSSIPPDEDMNSYAYKIFNTWGIGEKESDNGLLLLMIENGTPGSRMKIEVGYGLEGYITDAAAGRMLDDALPYYSEGDYSSAAYIIVSEASQKLEAEYVPGSAPGAETYLPVMILTIVSIAIILAFAIAAASSSRTKCPRCGSYKVKCVPDAKDSSNLDCKCSNCGLKFRKKRKRSNVYPFVYGGAMGGGGFGGGGFGGGASGGGGAGR